MVVEGALTHPCTGFAVGKPTMVVVRVQGAPQPLISESSDLVNKNKVIDRAGEVC